MFAIAARPTRASTEASDLAPWPMDWITETTLRLAAATGLDAGDAARRRDRSAETLLDLAGFAAHDSGERTNAPLLCFVLGRARCAQGADLDALDRAVRGARRAVMHAAVGAPFRPAHRRRSRSTAPSTSCGAARAARSAARRAGARISTGTCTEGTVVGDELVCPGHGWSFDCAGHAFKRTEFGRVDPKDDIETVRIVEAGRDDRALALASGPS